MRRRLLWWAALAALAVPSAASAAPAPPDPPTQLRGRPVLVLDDEIASVVLRAAEPIRRREDGTLAAVVTIAGRRTELGRVGTAGRSCYVASLNAADLRLRPGARYDVALTVYGEERNPRSLVLQRATPELLAGRALGC